MKKILPFLFAICLVFSITACSNKDNSGDDPSGAVVNTQFVEYSTAAVTVISDINALVGSEQAISLESETQVLPMSYRTTISDDETKSVYENGLGLAQYMTEQGIGLPLVCGDIGSEYFELTEFFGITFFIEGHDLTMKTIKKDDAYFTYAYNADSDIFLVSKLVYNSKTDYEITYYERNGLGYSYIYLASDLKGYGYIDNAEMKEAYYIDLNDVSYVSKAETVLNEMKIMCESEISASNFNEQSSGVVGVQSNYSITPAQFHESFNKYINWGGMIYSEDGFIVDSETGYLLGYETDDPSVTAIKIPETYDTLNGFYINAPNVKTVYIPKTVKYIKTSKASLKFNQTGKYGTEKESEIYVDCPIEFFSISHSQYHFNGNEKQSTIMSIEHFVVEDGSPLFSEKDGSLYSKDGIVLLYLADNPSVTDLVITADRISCSAKDILYKNASKLKSIEYNSDMTYFEQGKTKPFDLLSQIIIGLRNDAERTGVSGPTVKIDTVTVNNVSDEVEYEEGNPPTDVTGTILGAIANYDVQKVKIGRFIINGDFSDIDISDCIYPDNTYSVQIIGEIIVNSTNPDCVVSGILSTEELTIYKDYSDGELSIEYPNLKKLTIVEGVETFCAHDISSFGKTLDIYLPSTIKKFNCSSSANVIYHLAMNSLEFEYREELEQIDIWLPNEDSDAWKTNVIFETDEKEEKKLSDFKRYTINAEKRTLSLQGYYGTDEILVIPEAIYGFAVTWYDCSASTDTPLTASQIKEVHLSNTLKYLSVDYDWRLDKIVFDGTMEEFENLCQLEALFTEEITQLIECSNGTISPDRLPIYYFDDTAFVCELGDEEVSFCIENISVTAQNDSGLYVLTGTFEDIELSEQFDISDTEIRIDEMKLMEKYNGEFFFSFSVSPTEATLTLTFRRAEAIDDVEGIFMILSYIGTINSDDISYYIPD